MLAMLQGLGLIPTWRIFPTVTSFNPFSPLSPLQLSRLSEQTTPDTCIAFPSSIALSPIFLWWAVASTKAMVTQKIYKYLRLVIPKPRVPDTISLDAVVQDADSADLFGIDDVPGLCTAIDSRQGERENCSLLEEIAKDLQAVGRTYRILHETAMGCWEAFIGSDNSDTTICVQGLEAEELQSTHAYRGAVSLHQLQDDHEADGLAAMGTSRQDLLQTTSGPRENATVSSIPPPDEPHLESSPAPISLQSQMDLSLQTISISAIPEGTLTSDLNSRGSSPEVQQPLANIGHHSADSTIISRRTSAHTLPEIFMYQLNTFHRVTQLSAYPADALAKHLSSAIADVLFLPLETLFIRSLAVSFLSHPAGSPGTRAAAGRWKSQVYPLGGWFGLGLAGGWMGMCDYVCKMILVTGIQVGFGMAVWQVGYSLCFFLGKRCFGWGRL